MQDEWNNKSDFTSDSNNKKGTKPVKGRDP